MRGVNGEGSAGVSGGPSGRSGLPGARSVALDVVAVVTGLAGEVARGLDGTDGSGLLDVAQRARAASAWLASVELDAVSKLLRVQVREAREESHELARVASLSPPAVQAAGRNGDRWGWDWAVAEVAAGFRMSNRQADARVALARSLRSLPRVRGLLRAGLIDEYRARVIAEGLSMSILTPRDADWVRIEELACQKAPQRTHVQIRAHLMRQLLKIDPDATGRRRAKVLAGREVRVWPEPEGMATLHATLSAERAAIIDTTLNALADAARDHKTTADPEVAARIADTHHERRADALTDVFRSILEGRPLSRVPHRSLPGIARKQFRHGDHEPGTSHRW